MIQFLTWLCSPYVVGLVGLLVATVYGGRDVGKGAKIRRARVLQWLVLVWLWLWSMPVVVGLLGVWLESPYPYIDPGKQYKCDAIVLLGGGMGAPKQKGMPPEMFGAADRTWHAARLWHAGKGRYIIASGSKEREAALPLLLELGVPREAILIEDQALNTLGNGRYVKAMIEEKKLSKRVLLVTSAWHTRRSMMIFEKLGMEPVAAAADHSASYRSWICQGVGSLRWQDFVPQMEAVRDAGVYVKECQGLLGDRARLLAAP